MGYGSNCALKCIFEPVLNDFLDGCISGFSVTLIFASTSPQLCGSVLIMIVSPSPLLVCFPTWEGLACVSPLPPACYPQELDLLAPVKLLPAMSGSESKMTAKFWACFPGWWQGALYSRHSLRLTLSSLLTVFSSNQGYLVIDLWLGWRTLSGHCPHPLGPLPIFVPTCSPCVSTPAASS